MTNQGNEQGAEGAGLRNPQRNTPQERAEAFFASVDEPTESVDELLEQDRRKWPHPPQPMFGKPTIWREGERLRATDGSGYADTVADDQIRGHIRHPGGLGGAQMIAFAKAVLAVREYERIASGECRCGLEFDCGFHGRGEDQ
jgi:hypothetical protein